jgi:hypothetical protein
VLLFVSFSQSFIHSFIVYCVHHVSFRTLSSRFPLRTIHSFKMVNLTLILLSLPLLLQATPLVSRVAKNALVCDAGCTGSTCKRDVSPFGQDSSPFTLAKRHIDSAADLDEQPSHYIANRINGKSEKGAREGLKWDYTTVDATSIDGKFKVTKDKDPKTKVGDDVDNTRAWVEGLEG